MLQSSNDQSKMHYSVKTTDGSEVGASTDETFPTNKWVLVQVVHRTDESVSIYWDSVEKGTGSSIPLPLGTTANVRTWYLGAASASSTVLFEGKMKDIVFRNSDETYTFETLTKRQAVATNQGTTPVVMNVQLLPEAVLALPGLITFDASTVSGFLDARTVFPTTVYSGGDFSFVGWVKCLVVESSSTLEKIKFNAADES